MVKLTDSIGVNLNQQMVEEDQAP